MSRMGLVAFAALIALAVAGCRTSEIKNLNSAGLAEDVPTGSVQSGYGDGHGDSIGGGGAGQAVDATNPSKSAEGHDGH